MQLDPVNLNKHLCIRAVCTIALGPFFHSDGRFCMPMVNICHNPEIKFCKLLLMQNFTFCSWHLKLIIVIQ